MKKVLFPSEKKAIGRTVDVTKTNVPSRCFQCMHEAKDLFSFHVDECVCLCCFFSNQCNKSTCTNPEHCRQFYLLRYFLYNTFGNLSGSYCHSCCSFDLHLVGYLLRKSLLGLCPRSWHRRRIRRSRWAEIRRQLPCLRHRSLTCRKSENIKLAACKFTETNGLRTRQ